MEKPQKIWKKSDENLQRRFPAYFQHFRPEKISLGHILAIAKTRLYAKNQEKQMMKSRENAKKTGFSSIFPAFSAG